LFGLRAPALGRTYALATAFLVALLATTLAAPAFALTGGAGVPPPPPPAPGSGGTGTGTVPGEKAQLSPDGRIAIPPASAPPEVKSAVYAANQITNKPYRYGGGHRSFQDSGYDCSGSVSYALRGGKFVKRPLHSRAFMSWGEAGAGQWITVYTNPGHAYAMIAGLRFDTSGPGERGPRWRRSARSSRAYSARHPDGF
jgi:cell wall-associated NlpC family hydrolase